ncbi:unnamed protein product [Cuscuta europaea]|uniref:Gnk2-homologous domain-containing protein n=1 Tax=Cuscuta europaea TaxID=41803 RepID=A0A9P0YQK6_CUSEU|nr:unnamed protein product [Cuscuta europaea]
MLISAGAVQALVIIQMAAYTQRTSNKVYAMAFCRGDIGKATCQSCINNSGLRILLKCPNSLEVVFWDLVCTVRYSNTSMFGVNKEMLVITPTSPAKAQCSPDLDMQECKHCLGDSVQSIPQCCSGRQGAKVLKPSCSLRYEVSEFYGFSGIQGCSDKAEYCWVVQILVTTLVAVSTKQTSTTSFLHSQTPLQIMVFHPCPRETSQTKLMEWHSVEET